MTAIIIRSHLTQGICMTRLQGDPNRPPELANPFPHLLQCHHCMGRGREGSDMAQDRVNLHVWGWLDCVVSLSLIKIVPSDPNTIFHSWVFPQVGSCDLLTDDILQFHFLFGHCLSQSFFVSHLNLRLNWSTFINRPGVAGAVLQTPP